MTTKFKKASRSQARARVAIDGPAKAGKSFTSLRLAFCLGSKVAAIDTEFGSLSKYAGAAPDGIPFDFDVIELTNFAPHHYIDLIHEAEAAKYEVLVIDSLSHAWVGEGGILDQLDKQKSKNSYTSWETLTPQQRKLVDAILASPLHIVATMRSKMEYVLELVKGKQVPRKVGLAPVQREGMEYEFDLLISIDPEHNCSVSGSRCPAMDGKTALKPGKGFFTPYVEWLRAGTAATPSPAPQQQFKKPDPGAQTLQEMLANPTPLDHITDGIGQETPSIYSRLAASVRSAGSAGDLRNAAAAITEAKETSAVTAEELASLRSLYADKVKELS